MCENLKGLLDALPTALSTQAWEGQGASAGQLGFILPDSGSLTCDGSMETWLKVSYPDQTLPVGTPLLIILSWPPGAVGLQAILSVSKAGSPASL